MEQRIATSFYLNMLNSALSLTSESISQPTFVILYICNFIASNALKIYPKYNVAYTDTLVQFNVSCTATKMPFTVTKYCMLKLNILYTLL